MIIDLIGFKGGSSLEIICILLKVICCFPVALKGRINIYLTSNFYSFEEWTLVHYDSGRNMAVNCYRLVHIVHHTHLGFSIHAITLM